MGVMVEVEICEIPSLRTKNSLELALGDIVGGPQGGTEVAVLETHFVVWPARHCHRGNLPAASSLYKCSFQSVSPSRALSLYFQCLLLPFLVSPRPWICPFSTYLRTPILTRELGCGNEERAAYSAYSKMMNLWYKSI